MKPALFIVMALTLTLGGCARPMNQNRSRDERRDARHRDRPADQHRPDRDDRRSNSY